MLLHLSVIYSFLFLSNIPPCVCITICLFSSLANVYLDCYQFLFGINKYSLKICVHFYGTCLSIFMGTCFLLLLELKIP